ncbi:MAG: hypothetical protein JZU65_02070 [Chlorobium sp.]|jgi:hypothetical protein|nr:hypothetical protein [Chlorobium sp.]
MVNETSKIQRTLAAVVAGIAGIYFLTCAPTAAMRTLKIALEQALLRLVPHDYDFYPAIPLLTSTYSGWIILIFLAGGLSMMLIWPLYQGKTWARATALGAYGLATVGGMAMSIPWFVLVLAEYPHKGVPPHTVSGMPPSLAILFLGLAFYYTMLYADKDSLKNKLLKWIPYTFTGIVSGMVFMNAQHGARYFIHIHGEYFPDNAPNILSPLSHYITNLDYLDWKTFDVISTEPVYSAQTLTLLLGGYGLYIASIIMILSIPFMFMRKRIGWYMATGGAIATAVASFQGYLVRSSFEWGQGAALSTALLLILLIPYYRKMFLPEGD